MAAEDADISTDGIRSDDDHVERISISDSESINVVCDELASTFILQPAEREYNHSLDPCILSYMCSCDAEVVQNVRQWTPPPCLDSDALFALASEWIHHCTHTHTTCNVYRSPGFCPTRLLDLHPDAHSTSVRLLGGHGLPEGVKYATVSHVWGDSQNLKLTRANEAELLLAGIPQSQLPTHWNEAILVARRLGLRYLWLDSLCIMQDSREDWLREASTMSKVYTQGFVNIALAGADGRAEQACFARRGNLPHMMPQAITPTWSDEPTSLLYIVDEAFLGDLKGCRLRTRAWVFQEIYLSNRTLFLGAEQLWYQCSEAIACETYPGWAPDPWYDQTLQAPQRMTGTHRDWEDVVQEYSAGRLAFASDRVIAIAGVAQLLGEKLQDEYVAGLWMSQLPGELLWEVENPERRSWRPEQYSAPSWSWCSVEGAVVFQGRMRPGQDGLKEELCSVEDVHVVLQTTNDPMGPLTAGHIVLQATLHPVLLAEDRRVAIRDTTGVPQFLSSPPDDPSGEISFWTPDVNDGRLLETQWASRSARRKSSDDYDGAHADDTSLDAHNDQSDESLMHAYCLPVVRISNDTEGVPVCLALLLQRIVGGDREIYTRIGILNATGARDVGKFGGGCQRRVEIV